MDERSQLHGDLRTLRNGDLFDGFKSVDRRGLAVENYSLGGNIGRGLPTEAAARLVLYAWVRIDGLSLGAGLGAPLMLEIGRHTPEGVIKTPWADCRNSRSRGETRPSHSRQSRRVQKHRTSPDIKTISTKPSNSVDTLSDTCIPS